MMICSFDQAGISAAPARAVSAMKNMNLPQQIKDMKLPDLPAISGLKFQKSKSIFAKINQLNN